jgi:hypothetical protein
MSMPGAPQDDQRNAITMALMGIANPSPRPPPIRGPQQPQQPQGMPQNVSGGLTAVGNAIGGMNQPPPPPGPPMSLTPPAQQPPPMAPPQQAPMAPQGPPVGAGPMPQMPQGPQGIY